MTIKIDICRLLGDLPIEDTEIPEVMARYGASVSQAATRKWRDRGRLPVDRLAILLIESRKRRKSIDLLDYVSHASR